jgi:glycosyltransferase involved in cell wall biosynthesis
VVAMAEGGAGEFLRDGLEGFLVRDDREMAWAAAALLSASELLGRIKDHNRTTLPPTTWTTVVAQNLAAYAAAGADVQEPDATLAVS